MLQTRFSVSSLHKQICNKMKKTSLSLFWHFIATLLLVVSVTACVPADKHVVVLFTNDTHSQIYPLGEHDSRYPDMGGVERRKALVDSLRAEYPNLLLVDAGDVVQGTPYFTVFGGEVEMMAMNELGYDVRTLGNHEFDNGMEALAAMLAACNATTISTNYDVAGTVLAEHVLPTTICDVEGIKVGFIGLDVQPDGLIDASRRAGVTYIDPLAGADSAALALRNQGAEVVIALSHLGYDSEVVGAVVDSMVVQNTRYIDMIIGGHSHSCLMPPSQFTNLDGREVVVAQTGKSGAYLGFAHITISESKQQRVSIDYTLLPVDKRYDDRIDSAFTAKLDVYRHPVDSIMSVVLGTAATNMEATKPESLLTNWVSDAFVEIARQRSGARVDFSIINTGGVRTNIDAGDVTRGNLFSAFPFDNRLSIVTLRGSDVKALFDIISSRGGEGVSREVRLVIKDGKTHSLTIAGKPVDDNRLYKIATLDYLANGNDNLVTFKQSVARRDYPDMIRGILEQYVLQLTAQGKSIEAVNDGRVVIE